MTYKWKPKTSIKADPQEAGAVIDNIIKRSGGTCTPGALVDASIPNDAPLHDEFEWNDKKAARAHRETQARYILRSIVVVTEESRTKEPDKVIRAYVTTSGDEGYRSIKAVMSQPDLRHELLIKAWGELQSWRRRYEELHEFAGIFEAIEKVKAVG